MPTDPADRIIRSRRRSIALTVEPGGTLVVRAPLWASDAQIAAVLKGRADWIEQARTKMAARFPLPPPKKFSSGEQFRFLGELHPLRITAAARTPLAFDGGFTLAQRALPRAGEVFRRWYREQAGRVFQERTEFYAARMGTTCRQVRITSAQTRWGSCSPTGTISFTWRLVMAPLPVIDYVVVHELVHLRVKNHGQAFWAGVKTVLPGYTAQRDWLKTNGHLLTI